MLKSFKWMDGSLTAPAVLKINDGAVTVGCTLNRVGWDWASTAAISMLQGIFANRHILRKIFWFFSFPQKSKPACTKRWFCIRFPLHQEYLLFTLWWDATMCMYQSSRGTWITLVLQLQLKCIEPNFRADAFFSWAAVECSSSYLDRGEWSQHPVEENTEISPNNNKQQQQQTTQIPQQTAHSALGWHN